MPTAIFSQKKFKFSLLISCKEKPWFEPGFSGYGSETMVCSLQSLLRMLISMCAFQGKILHQMTFDRLRTRFS
jgi:hypothetical protein